MKREVRTAPAPGNPYAQFQDAVKLPGTHPPLHPGIFFGDPQSRQRSNNHSAVLSVSKPRVFCFSQIHSLKDTSPDHDGVKILNRNSCGKPRTSISL